MTITIIKVSPGFVFFTIGRTHWHKYFGQFRKRDVGGKRVRQIRFTPIGHQGNV